MTRRVIWAGCGRHAEQMGQRVLVGTLVVQVPRRNRGLVGLLGDERVEHVGVAGGGIGIVVIVLIAMFFLLEGPARWVGLLGLVALGTGLFSFCPLYTVLGINTCPARR